MKILHTSDWHIGKKIMGRERYEEYSAVLAEISDICRKEHIELVLVAGDVYDTYTPSAESEKIFFNGVREIAKYSAVLIISGNHDDNVRLSASAAFAGELNVYIAGNNLQELPCSDKFPVHPVESGNGYAIFENKNGERVYINILPYPNEARFKEGKTEESFDDKMTRWISSGEKGKKVKMPSVFLSHLFVAGGSASDSEREIDLGGARIVKTSLLPDCDYCALGHLHKRQNIGNNVHYSGAVMQFSFDEAGAEKSVNVFELNDSGVNDFKQIPLKSFKQLIRVQANSVEDGIKLVNLNIDKYVELTLNLSAPLTPSESSALRECENLISLRADIINTDALSERVSNKNKSSSQLFTEYYKSRYDASPSDELLELFLSLTEEE